MYKLVLFLALISCGTLKPDSWIHPDLAEYYSRFLDEANKRGVRVYSGPIIIKFVGELEGTVIGRCDSYLHKREVLIESSFWNTSNEYDREILVFHELGHCLLDQDHRDHRIGTRHASIMNPTQIWWIFYKEYREEYLDELFGG